MMTAERRKKVYSTENTVKQTNLVFNIKFGILYGKTLTKTNYWMSNSYY